MLLGLVDAFDDDAAFALQDLEDRPRLPLALPEITWTMSCFFNLMAAMIR